MCRELRQLLDNIVTHKFEDIFKIYDIQNGLRKDSLIVQCCFKVNEAAEYYRSNDVTISLTVLNTSKAFY